MLEITEQLKFVARGFWVLAYTETPPMLTSSIPSLHCIL